MQPYLEVWGPEGARLVPLAGDRVTIGRASENTLPLTDPEASRLHAVLERFPTTWSVRDLGSRNGTFVNGSRVGAEHPLSPGDEIRVGQTRLLYRDDSASAPLAPTAGAEPPPRLTPRERDVLIALFRSQPGGAFTEPASTRQIASALFVSETAVKAHMRRLYDKFDVHEGPRRRLQLANEALRRGAVTLAEVRRAAQGP